MPWFRASFESRSKVERPREGPLGGAPRESPRAIPAFRNLGRCGPKPIVRRSNDSRVGTHLAPFMVKQTIQKRRTTMRGIGIGTIIVIIILVIIIF